MPHDHPGGEQRHIVLLRRKRVLTYRGAQRIQDDVLIGLVLQFLLAQWKALVAIAMDKHNLARPSIRLHFCRGNIAGGRGYGGDHFISL